MAESLDVFVVVERNNMIWIGSACTDLSLLKSPSNEVFISQDWGTMFT